MALDLSALDTLETAPSPALAVKGGTPLKLRLVDIDEDPNQPRTEFDEDDLSDLAASIKVAGILSPISVRPHPTSEGRYIINHGARRYRASLAAGKTEIPAFVDESHDEFGQVIENLQRSNLTAMELASFVAKRYAQGDKASEIAKKLGKSKSFITYVGALIDPPEGLEAAYRAGRCKSPQTLYDLRNLLEKHPEQAGAILAGDEEITRSTVSKMAERLKKGLPLDSEESETDTVQAEQLPPGEAEDKEKPAKIPDPNKLSKPLLLVEFDGRSASVILNTRPSSPGLIYIKYEDNGEVHEVDAGKCKINSLLEGKGG